MQTTTRSWLVLRKRSAGLIAALVLALIQVAPAHAGAEPIPTCNGLPATIVGTPSVDELTGTPGDDVIVGLGGDDLIMGGGGNDTICGNGGHDLIYGEDGDDVLFGQRGEDYLSGGDGDDRIFGGLEADRIDGGDGDDGLFGQRGDDRIGGAEGNDRIFGGHDADFIVGGLGNDRLFGQPGDDTIAGTNGYDRLGGGAGDDHLWGGLGRDRQLGGTGSDICHIDGPDNVPETCDIIGFTDYQTLTVTPVLNGSNESDSDYGDEFFDGALTTAFNDDMIPISMKELTGKSPFQLRAPVSGEVKIVKYLDPQTPIAGTSEIVFGEPPQISVEVTCCLAH